MTAHLNLSLNETRVIGCLLEKESTTPDLYPLTLNSLVNACNQKSNRDPVLVLSSVEVKSTLDDLVEKRLVSEEGGSRTSKYRHRFCNTMFSDLQLTEQERAIVCILLLRGPQTPGEIRSRTGRLAQFSDVSQVETVLKGMEEKEWVTQLTKEPGRRESRFAHLFSGPVMNQPAAVETRMNDQARIRELEHEVLVLKAEIERLNALIANP